MMAVGKLEPTDRQAAKLDEAQRLSRRSQALLAAAGMSEPIARRWYVLTIEQGADIPVDNALTNSGVEHWMPSVKRSTKWRGGRRFQRFCPVVAPACPGYMFVHVEWVDGTWDGLKSVEGVVEVIGGPMSPSPLQDKDFTTFRALVNDDPNFLKKLTNALKVGDDVLIHEGLARGFIGIVRSLMEETGRLEVEVDASVGTFKADLSIAQVTKLE